MLNPHRNHRLKFYCLDLALRSKALMYYLNQNYEACTRAQIHLSSGIITSFKMYYLSASIINGGIFIYIHPSGVAYRNMVSMSMTRNTHLLFIQIIHMMHSVTSNNNGEQLFMKYNPGIWSYPNSTRRSLNWIFLIFVKDPIWVN